MLLGSRNKHLSRTTWGIKMPFSPSAHWPTNWKSLICNTGFPTLWLLNARGPLQFYFLLYHELSFKCCLGVNSRSYEILFHAISACGHYLVQTGFFQSVLYICSFGKRLCFVFLCFLCFLSALCFEFNVIFINLIIYVWLTV